MKPGRRQAETDFLDRMATLLEQGNGTARKRNEIPLIDPTANVLSLVGAAMLRQDDLRAAGELRQRDLDRSEHRHAKSLAKLTTKFQDAQFLAEKNRVDAQLSDAKSAVAIAAQRTELTALALAERVTESAKTLATAADATAKTLAAATEAIAAALGARIGPLEQARYESAGGKEQRGESRHTAEWTIERYITLGVAALGLVYFIITQAQGARI